MGLSRVCLAAAALAVAISPAQLRSQACAGVPSLRDARVNIGVHASSYTYATALGASVAMGRTVFGALGAGMTRDEELDAGTLDLGLEAGADFALGPRREGAFCPIVGLGLSLGPSDFLLRPNSYRRFEAAIGFDAAVVLLRRRGLAGFLTGSARIVRSSATVTHPGDYGYTRTGHNTYAAVSLGASVLLCDALTVRAGLSKPLGLLAPDPATGVLAAPFGRRNQEVAAQVGIGVGLGRKRSDR